MRLRASRATGMVLVLLVHGLAVWLVWRATANREPVLAQRWAVVRLLPPARQAAAERPAPPASRRVDTRPATAAALEPDSQDDSADGDVAAAQPAIAAGTGVGAAAAAAPGAAPLVLLPSKEVLRGALANPATQDPRANSPRPSAEERMAMAIDNTLCVREERLPDGSVRRWMGRLKRVASAIEMRTGLRGIDVGVCE